MFLLSKSRCYEVKHDAKQNQANLALFQMNMDTEVHKRVDVESDVASSRAFKHVAESESSKMASSRSPTLRRALPTISDYPKQVDNVPSPTFKYVAQLGRRALPRIVKPQHEKNSVPPRSVFNKSEKSDRHLLFH